MQINEKIFRAYDIRGMYPDELNEDVFYNLGIALVSYLRNSDSKVAVGRDSRDSSDSLCKSFVGGLENLGCHVIDLGVVTTPMLYFAASFLDTDAGAMITASHNPLNYNGVKFVKKGGVPVSGEELKNFYSENFKVAENKKGKTEKKDISEDYFKKILKDFGIKRKIKIKIDDGGGAAKLFLPRFLDKLRVERVGMSADLAVSFDFDADRLYVFDENGEKIREDIVGGIIADGIVQKGQKVIIDIISTKFLEDYFAAKGVEVVRAPVGHYYIKNAMRNNDAVFAAELSGHYYFGDLYYSDSAFFALRKLLEAMDKNEGKNISELVKPFQKYFHSGEINLSLKSREEWGGVLEKIKDKYSSVEQDLQDGILIEFEDPAGGGTGWWFNLRPSNTEPLMRLVIEAKSEALMEEKKKELVSFLN